ncbi:MAG TPA: M20/M25/M40 family metallo-hydrolase, partial [Terriglobales bacterium]|nr:M20/M25/M40 family metallo-hydrolase [Terriglobales bacterium]
MLRVRCGDCNDLDDVTLAEQLSRRYIRDPMKRVGLLALLLSVTAFGAEMSAPAIAARNYRQAHEAQLLRDFQDLLAIPNIASDTPNIQRNADALVSMLQKRKVNAQLLKVEGAPPVVYGEIKTPGAKHTIVFYAHYDGQPVTPSEWENNAPFTPQQKTIDGEPFIVGRSASDDKGSIFAQLTALDALQAANIPIKSNIRFVWEGEEEAGSPHLGQILEANKQLVTGDVFLICDGPVDQSRQQTVVFGARGDTHLEVTVYGPKRELHSGHYGNWAPNPAMMLAQLLASMKDDKGHVLIPHFYDGIAPLTPLEKQAIADAPNNDQRLREELWLGHTEGGGERLLNLINLPTLNINGMASARTGARSNNVVPSNAIADIDLRLVKGLDWRQQQDRVIDFIKSRGYTVVEIEPSREVLLQNPMVAYVKRDLASYNAVRTSMDLPVAQLVISAVEGARGKVIKLPTMGGSVPLEMIEHATSAPTISVPIANH